jgi:hypothetical protein
MLLISTVPVQDPVQSPPEIKPVVFNSADRAGEDKWRSFFMFSVGGYDYVIRSDGRSEIGFGKSRPRNFDLRISPKGYLEQLYYLEHGTDVLLIYEARDQLNGWGYVARLNQKPLKLKWVTPVAGYNIGPGLVDANDLFLTAAGLIAKVDLQSGTYVWQQQNLDKKYSSLFEAFGTPWMEKERVFFKERGANPKTLEVDKTTGEVLNVQK